MRIILLIFVLFINGSLFATLKSGKFGAEFAYGGTVGPLATNDYGSLYISAPGIGLWYHFSERIAISLKLSGYFTENNRNYSTSSTNESRLNNQTIGGGFGIELPFYMVNFEPVLLFIGPGGGLSYSRSLNTVTNSNGTPGYEEHTYSSYFSAYAVVGLQFPFHERLHIFGRTTLGYTGGVSRQDVYYSNSQHTKNGYAGIQSWGLGIIFYLI